MYAHVCDYFCMRLWLLKPPDASGRNGKSSWGFFKATPLPRACATQPTSESAVKIRSFASYPERFPSLGIRTRFARIFKCTFWKPWVETKCLVHTQRIPQ
ncbi:hypothetical protein TGRUB_263335 [Toxoplasma gondii RUB]|uniref:Uncharacterized protein n=1 Tax=Toxoplasma gondii RUB TaxID=935652 RepID=A0A086M9L7_TOXGO|nr:hypothetical protein TGRUB_263335 [Toxoplasma gondii RUB]